MGNITWNGISSNSLGLVVEKVPNMDRPARKYDRYQVPGRNGDIFVMQDAWENVEQSYEIWWADSVSVVGYSLSEWLFGPTGYQTLEDDFDPDHYRKAVFTGPYDVENILQKYGRATITFDCDPRRFLTSGLTWIPIPSGMGPGLDIVNPTPFPAKPVFDITNAPSLIANIIVSNSGSSTMLTISKAGHFIVDSARESIVDEYGVPAFGSTWGKFPTLYPGTSNISPQNNAKIQPNWWTL